MENLNTKIDGNKGTQKDKLTDAKKEELVDALKQELEEKMSAWDIDAFGEYVMKYCTKKEDLKLQINLPAKWKFKWLNFECNTRDLMSFFEDKPYGDEILGHKLANLLYGLEDYIEAYWIKTYDAYEPQDRILKPIFKKYHIL